MKPLRLAALAAIALLTTAPAFASQTSPLQMGMVAHTSGSPAEGTGAMLCTAPIIPPVNGQINSMSAWADNGTGNAQFAIYSGAVSSPSTLTLQAYTASTSLGGATGEVDAPFTGGSGLVGGVLPVTAGNAYYPCFQLDNGTGAISNPYRGDPGVQRYYQTGTTYGSPPSTMSSLSNQTAFGWYSVWGNYTVATGYSVCGWPGPLDQAEGGNVGNLVGYQKCIPPKSGNVVALLTWMGPWAGSAPTLNMGVYAMDSGVSTGSPQSSDQYSKTLIGQATPITPALGIGWLIFTPSGTFHLTAGAGYTVAGNVNVNGTTSALCIINAGGVCSPDPTLGAYYYTFTDPPATYTCCTFATLTGTQISNLSNNSADWLANVAITQDDPPSAVGHATIF